MDLRKRINSCDISMDLNRHKFFLVSNCLRTIIHRFNYPVVVRQKAIRCFSVEFLLRCHLRITSMYVSVLRSHAYTQPPTSVYKRTRSYIPMDSLPCLCYIYTYVHRSLSEAEALNRLKMQRISTENCHTERERGGGSLKI